MKVLLLILMVTAHPMILFAGLDNFLFKDKGRCLQCLKEYDIESFKNAIKDAFISIQNPRTGKVISIEVVPWSENTEFQSLLGLEKKTVGYAVKSGEDGQELAAGNPLNLYEKKYNLNQNAEFLAEIERSDRALMNIYYKAKICRKYVDTNWKKLSGGNRVF